MVLRDATGNVVDGLNYGLHVDPWAGEGYHGNTGRVGSGCKAPLPNINNGTSAGRFPDGSDNDSNCRDFLLQNTCTMQAAAMAGSDNIKVSSVANFSPGQKIIIDKDTNRETAVIATVGTSGSTTTITATRAGTTVIPVVGVGGFAVGQTIIIGSGGNRETAVIASITRSQGRPGRPDYVPNNSFTLASPLTKAHYAGIQVSGSGITLTSPLTRTHDIGTQVASNIPTPGEPNQYIR